MRKAKYQRTNTFKFWCWRRLLRVSWTTRTSNQSILKDINSEYSLERLLLKLKLQYFDHLIRRANSLELLCWRRVLRVPWTARRSNQFILKEISPEYLLEGLMLKLKLQYFGYLMQRVNSLEKTWCWERLKAGREGDNRRRGGWLASLTQWTWVWVSSRSWWWTGRPGVLRSMEWQRVGYDWATEKHQQCPYNGSTPFERVLPQK